MYCGERAWTGLAVCEKPNTIGVDEEVWPNIIEKPITLGADEGVWPNVIEKPITLD